MEEDPRLVFAVEKSAESSSGGLSRWAVTISVASSALTSTECGLISNARLRESCSAAGGCLHAVLLR